MKQNQGTETTKICFLIIIIITFRLHLIKLQMLGYFLIELCFIFFPSLFCHIYLLHRF